jgi:hypothetical protein
MRSLYLSAVVLLHIACTPLPSLTRVLDLFAEKRGR